MKPAIKIENLSKQYRLGLVGTGTLSHDLKRWWHLVRGKEDPYLKIGDTNDRSTKGLSEYVWALQDINLEVMPGEVLGIIGKNGAGKSTLLKILSKVTGPTTGKITYNGRIGSLLEVGTGFHPELTGRENIYLNGSILGMRKFEIDRKFDEIVDFSGVERYIDTPAKRYSSGMTVRLGFAVAAFLEPEILVVDEVLAVGDAEFQKKAIGKMQDVSKNDGRTVLFVSHNMSTVEALCKRAIVLANGKVEFIGNIKESIEHYLNTSFVEANSIYKNNFINKDLEVNVITAYLKDSKGNIKDSYSNLEPIIIEFEVNIKEVNSYLKIGFELYQNAGKPLIASFHNDLIDDEELLLTEGINTIQFIIPENILNKGTYSVRAVATIHRVKWIYQIDNILSFSTIFKLKNTSMPIEKRPSIIAPLVRCQILNS